MMDCVEAVVNVRHGCVVPYSARLHHPDMMRYACSNMFRSACHARVDRQVPSGSGSGLRMRVGTDSAFIEEWPCFVDAAVVLDAAGDL